MLKQGALLQGATRPDLIEHWSLEDRLESSPGGEEVGAHPFTVLIQWFHSMFSLLELSYVRNARCDFYRAGICWFVLAWAMLVVQNSKCLPTSAATETSNSHKHKLTKIRSCFVFVRQTMHDTTQNGGGGGSDSDSGGGGGGQPFSRFRKTNGTKHSAVFSFRCTKAVIMYHFMLKMYLFTKTGSGHT